MIFACHRQLLSTGIKPQELENMTSNVNLLCACILISLTSVAQGALPTTITGSFSHKNRTFTYRVELFDVRFNPERDEDSEFKVEKARKRLRKATAALADARPPKKVGTGTLIQPSAVNRWRCGD